jgi:hypothetical protein
MFQNPQFGQRWFYAFIEKLKYKNGNISDVVLKLDVYQTFMFDFTIQDTFIERQTFDTDYYNTLSDTPSTGDLRTIWEYEKSIGGKYFILFNSDPTQEDSSTSASNYPTIGNYSMPCIMCICETADILAEIIQAVSNKGRADRIQACYYAPCWSGNSNYTLTTLPRGDLDISLVDLPAVDTLDLNKLYEFLTLNITYSPIFKKEISYPYAKLEIVDKITGRFIELDLSKFTNPLSPQFQIIYNVTDNVEYKIIPLNYNGIPYSIENALVIRPSTDLPVFSNSYAKYLKDNQAQNVLSGVMAGASAIGSILTGNVAGAVGSFGSVANTLLADSVAQKQPNQVSGLKGDAFDYLNYDPCIYFRVKIMDNDHMKIARNFWNAYGYPVRRIATFNNTSNRYNFIKTVGCNLTAENIPSEFQRELESIFDKGVTIWNNNYLNYDIL